MRAPECARGRVHRSLVGIDANAGRLVRIARRLERVDLSIATSSRRILWR